MNLSDLSDADLLELERKTKQKIAEYNNKQMALKILLNGGYGALSNVHNRWYSDDLAESVTLSGQLSARWIIQYVNIYFNEKYNTKNVDYVVATDTDSIHLNLEPAVEKKFGSNRPDHETLMAFLEQEAEVLDKVIAQGFKELSDMLNVYEAAMHMKLETISEAVWTGKKHYAMSVWANEGIRYNPPKLKMVGIEAVKSSTPKVCRDWMKQVIPLIIRGDRQPIKDFFEQKWQEFKTLAFDQVAFPRTVNNLADYYDPVTIYGKKCPPHVRGALLYNNLLDKMGLRNQLMPINSGDKIRFSYMTLPNPLRENMFACPDTLPKQFELDQYIDYEKQFDKTFKEPLMHLIDAAGINMSDDIDISMFEA